MNWCKPCAAATLLVLFPALKLSESGPDQGSILYMPGWVWWVLILVALVAIFWWWLYLRPGQAAEILDLEHQIEGGHGHVEHGEQSQAVHETQPHTAIISEPDTNLPAAPQDKPDEE